MPSITKEMLEERLGVYQKELQQLFTMQKTYDGAIQDINYWLEQLNKKEETDG
jgi:hypothetical protein